jgi:Chromo (CHRromatin Organisation MOdifier) domain
LFLLLPFLFSPSHYSLSILSLSVLSANAEEEARAMADGAVLRKVVKSRKRKYFVKWRGLSYRESTWETAKVRQLLCL